MPNPQPQVETWDPLRDLRGLIREPSAVAAPTGNEDRLTAAVEDHVQKRGWVVERDRLAQLAVTMGPADANTSVVLLAHLDELGLVVRAIEEDGWIRVHRLGGMPERVRPGLRMVVHTEKYLANARHPAVRREGDQADHRPRPPRRGHAGRGGLRRGHVLQRERPALRPQRGPGIGGLHDAGGHRVRPDGIPFGVDFLWDPKIELATAVATGASFMREVTTGVWESDMGLWNTNFAKTLRERRNLERDDLAVFMNITPEFASPIGARSAPAIARSTVISSLADTILVSIPWPEPHPMCAASPGVRRRRPRLSGTGR